jgi:hypothetical protein
LGSATTRVELEACRRSGAMDRAELSRGGPTTPTSTPDPEPRPRTPIPNPDPDHRGRGGSGPRRMARVLWGTGVVRWIGGALGRFGDWDGGSALLRRGPLPPPAARVVRVVWGAGSVVLWAGLVTGAGAPLYFAVGRSRPGRSRGSRRLGRWIGGGLGRLGDWCGGSALLRRGPLPPRPLAWFASSGALDQWCSGSAW